jgi:hypothetical protein
MGNRPKTAIAGFGIGLIVTLPTSLLIALGIVAFGMVIYGLIPYFMQAFGRIRMLRIRSPFIIATSMEKQAKSTPSWLETVLEDDRTNLGKHIHIKTPPQYFTKGLFDTEPKIEVMSGIVNATCFPILIAGVQGALTIQGTKCNFDLKLDGSTRIPHGESSNIGLTQRVTKETVGKMVKLHNERDGFMVDFATCQLLIQPEIPYEEHKPIEIGIGIHEKIRL